VAAVPVLAFAPSLLNRAEQAVTSGSVLAVTWLASEAEYLQYNQRVLNGDIRQRVAAAQAKVPAGEEVMVWMNAPFYLDYARDRIENVEPAEGFVTPWAKMPDARFFIWEYTGYPKEDEADDAERMARGPDLMRRVSATRLNMTRWMNDLMQHSEKLYDDGTIAVFRR
jgi:hypothetical protein